MRSAQSGAPRLRILSASECTPADSSADVLAALLHEDEQRMRQLLAAAHDAGEERHAASGIRPLARLLWRLSRAAYTDALTGLGNRRGFMRDGSRLLNLAARRRRYVALFFIDVDGLKTVNDTEGHAAGDELLRAAAQVLNATFRNGDIVARVGGDEFAVATMVSRADAAAVILRRFARALTRANSIRRARPIEVSVGASVFSPEQPQLLSVLLEQADRRMYEDKRARAALESYDGAGRADAADCA